MKKTRVAIPKAVSESVMKEYHHKCAMCGRHEPQLHHIDENPSNNDASNILPLCPNCHLQDTHDPTAPYDSEKLRLFRRCKDPFILDPRFHPIWTRIALCRAQLFDRGSVYSHNPWTDLLNFVRTFEKGAYYADRLVNAFSEYSPQPESFFLKVEDARVEMLRYQGWERPNPRE